MNSSQKKKAGCTKCDKWHQGDKRVYPMGFCLLRNAKGIDKLKSCPKKTLTN